MIPTTKAECNVFMFARPDPTFARCYLDCDLVFSPEFVLTVSLKRLSGENVKNYFRILMSSESKCLPSVSAHRFAWIGIRVKRKRFASIYR